MKFEFPIAIDMKDFIKRGSLDCVRIGWTKELILSNFPDPDRLTENVGMSFSDTVWTWGSLQMFFSQNVLNSIFCEDMSLAVPQSLTVDRWILDGALSLIECIRAFNIEGLDYTVKRIPKTMLRNAVEVVVAGEKGDSHVSLVFEAYRKFRDDPNGFILHAFHCQGF